jgi:hypothetical protein
MDADYIAGSSGNAGLMAFTRTLGGTASADNLRVVGINPGAIATDRSVTIMKKRALDRFGDAERWPELMQPPALWSRRDAGGHRLGGGLPGIRQVRLHHGHDHHHLMAAPPTGERCFDEPARQGCRRHWSKRRHRLRNRTAFRRGRLQGHCRLQQSRC